MALGVLTVSVRNLEHKILQIKQCLGEVFVFGITKKKMSGHVVLAGNILVSIFLISFLITSLLLEITRSTSYDFTHRISVGPITGHQLRS